MERAEKVVIILLVLAVLFSVASIAFNLYVFNLSESKVNNSFPSGNGASNLNIVVEGNASPPGGSG